MWGNRTARNLHQRRRRCQSVELFDRSQLFASDASETNARALSSTERRSRSPALLYYTILYYTILYYTILHYTTLHYTTIYYTILYYSIQYGILYYRSCKLFPCVSRCSSIASGKTRSEQCGGLRPTSRLVETCLGGTENLTIMIITIYIICIVYVYIYIYIYIIEREREREREREKRERQRERYQCN